MRKFLPELKIVGAMLISKEGRDILDISIPNLMKWSDWVLLMLDNESKESKEIALYYQNTYPDKVVVEYTGLSRLTEDQEKERSKGLLRRFKRLHGPIRQAIFDSLQNRIKKGEKVDILLFPDADEIFSNSLPELLEQFWAMPDKKAISMNWVTVFNDMKTIFKSNGGGHTRILKFAMDFTAIPHQKFSHYVPLTKEDRLGSRCVLIHLSQLTKENREKRKDKWKFGIKGDEELCRLDKDVREMTPDKIKEVYRGEAHCFTRELL